MEYFFYWTSVVNSVVCAATACFIAGIFVIAILTGLYFSFDNEYEKDRKPKRIVGKFLKGSIIGWVISFLLMVFVPDKKTLYLMKGVGILEEVANNEKVRQLPAKTVDLLDAVLERELDKLKDDGEKKSK